MRYKFPAQIGMYGCQQFTFQEEKGKCCRLYVETTIWQRWMEVIPIHCVSCFNKRFLNMSHVHTKRQWLLKPSLLLEQFQKIFHLSIYPSLYLSINLSIYYIHTHIYIYYIHTHIYIYIYIYIYIFIYIIYICVCVCVCCIAFTLMFA